MPPVKQKPTDVPAPKATPKLPPKTEPRVVYDKFDVKLFGYDNPMTADQAKQILGWEEVVPGGGEHVLVDETGKKVRFANSTRNRPFTPEDARRYTQELLQGRWKLNGETAIVGRSGEVISFQHRGAAVVLAKQRWEKEDHWKERWPDGPPGMPLILVTGAEEDDDTVNTIDTGRPRTQADMLYRSNLFVDYGSSDRRVLARMTDYCVRLLWDRTGADKDAFAPRKTHAELMDFIDRHPRVVACVKHIFTENQVQSVRFLPKEEREKPANQRRLRTQISDYISPGYASGMMYLMGCSTSDPSVYRKGDPRKEDDLDWENWDRANDFWVLFHSDKEFEAVRTAASPYDGVDEAGKKVVLSRHPLGEHATLTERTALLARAWTEWTTGSMTKKNLQLAYVDSGDGPSLVDRPTVGGIDMGPGGEHDDVDPDESDVPTPEQVEERKGAVRPPVEPSADDTMDHLREAHPGKMLFFRGKPGSDYVCYGVDAVAANRIDKTVQLSKTEDGRQVAKVKFGDWDAVVPKLFKAGHSPAVVTPGQHGQLPVVKVVPKPKEEPKLAAPAKTPIKPKPGKK